MQQIYYIWKWKCFTKKKILVNTELPQDLSRWSLKFKLLFHMSKRERHWIEKHCRHFWMGKKKIKRPYQPIQYSPDNSGGEISLFSLLLTKWNTYSNYNICTLGYTFLSNYKDHKSSCGLFWGFRSYQSKDWSPKTKATWTFIIIVICISIPNVLCM